eukprot:Rhum_TRINITY_DN5978_c0_g1::Rhum_TRINITY_DN5978_c0_g1_i1::g.18849::m.18849
MLGIRVCHVERLGSDEPRCHRHARGMLGQHLVNAVAWKDHKRAGARRNLQPGCQLLLFLLLVVLRAVRLELSKLRFSGVGVQHNLSTVCFAPILVEVVHAGDPPLVLWLCVELRVPVPHVADASAGVPGKLRRASVERLPGCVRDTPPQPVHLVLDVLHRGRQRAVLRQPAHRVAAQAAVALVRGACAGAGGEHLLLVRREHVCLPRGACRVLRRHQVLDDDDTLLTQPPQHALRHGGVLHELLVVVLEDEWAAQQRHAVPAVRLPRVALDVRRERLQDHVARARLVHADHGAEGQALALCKALHGGAHAAPACSDGDGLEDLRLLGVGGCLGRQLVCIGGPQGAHCLGSRVLPSAALRECAGLPHSRLCGLVLNEVQIL